MNMLNSALVKGKTSNPIIYIKNQFIDSICKLSIGERRIIWFWLEAYKFDSVHTLTRDVIIDHGEYARTFQLTASHAAKEIRTALSAFPDNTVYEARPEWIDNVISCLDEKILSEDDLLSLAPFKSEILQIHVHLALNVERVRLHSRMALLT
ncbi:RepB family plasmid replication initiator protein [Psychromonas sp. KJ10-2]|uniref:RepB family plasmid replication initiator protein n=1 Tax=Psychromonas sp. KJ10-2 TaxID=3391822 RepID=UPI0039B62A41